MIETIKELKESLRHCRHARTQYEHNRCVAFPAIHEECYCQKRYEEAIIDKIKKLESEQQVTGLGTLMLFNDSL